MKKTEQTYRISLTFSELDEVWNHLDERLHGELRDKFVKVLRRKRDDDKAAKKVKAAVAGK